MKFVGILVLVLIMTAFAGCFSGCAKTDASSTVTSALVTTQTTAFEEPAIFASSESTALITLAPEATAKSSEQPSPQPTPLPTPMPTTAATAKPTAKPTRVPTSQPTDSGKIVLAEGFYAIRLDAALRSRITGMSYPADATGCKVSYDDLRYLKLRHYDFAGQVREGELIVNVQLADEVLAIFYELYQAKYALTSVRLVDDFGEPANDDLSMAANNTSAFNYRTVTGTSTLSRHSYGAAIDINPMLNPYIVGDRVAPPNGAEYVDRTREFAGKIDHDDLCYKLFRQYGWSWGGDWSGDKDYQHFSKKLD